MASKDTTYILYDKHSYNIYNAKMNVPILIFMQTFYTLVKTFICLINASLDII